jgi:hypothetical protein
METNYIHEEVAGGVPIKLWTRGVAVEHKQLPKAIEPTEANLDDPAPFILRRVALLGVSTLSAVTSAAHFDPISFWMAVTSSCGTRDSVVL